MFNANDMANKRIYGLVAEFESPDQLLDAAHRAREAGYRSSRCLLAHAHRRIGGSRGIP